MNPMPASPFSAAQARQLEELLDREAIREVLFRYARGVDRADEAALRSAYWPDATDCHGAYRGSADGFIAQALERLRRGGLRSHVIGNILIELHGAQAVVESYFIALQAPVPAQVQDPVRATLLAGRYADRFEKRSGEWRVAERTVVYDWIEETERPDFAQGAALFGPRQPVGTLAPMDAIYALRERMGSLPVKT